MNSFKKLFLTKFCLLIVFNLAMGEEALAQPDSGEVRSLLEERDREIKELLGPKGTTYSEDQREQLKDIINGIIDYRAMARHALAETYDTLSTAQRDEFVDLFSQIIRDQSLNKLDIYRAEVSYKMIEVTGDKARVHTIANLDNVRTPVIYDMRYEKGSVNGQGQWMVEDMTIDDVSTAESYRRQFQRIIRKRSYDYLLETLQKRASKSENP